MLLLIAVWLSGGQVGNGGAFYFTQLCQYYRLELIHMRLKTYDTLAMGIIAVEKCHGDHIICVLWLLGELG